MTTTSVPAIAVTKHQRMSAPPFMGGLRLRAGLYWRAMGETIEQARKWEVALLMVKPARDAEHAPTR